MIHLLAQGSLNTKYGEFTEYLFYDGQSESIAVVRGEVANAADVLCRIHSHCVPAHVFNSIECDCREQLELAQQKIADEGRGVIVWLDQPGKGNGHMAELLSAQFRAEGVPQTEAYVRLGYQKDARSFVRAAEIIKYLGVSSVRLMTNNPAKLNSLTEYGVDVSGTVELFIEPDNADLRRTYLDKIENQNHSIRM
jgi:GTP cyclohydrolase II